MTSFVPDLPDPAMSRAVLVGIAAYRSLPPVGAVATNVASFRRVLTDPALLGLPSEHVVTLGDADVEGSGGAEVVMGRIREVAQKAGDALIIYLAGHGLRGDGSNGDELYLAMPHTTTEDRIFTALPFRLVEWALDASPAARKIVILDTCFSGHALDAPTTTVRRGLADRGVAMLASSPPTRPSLVVDGAEHTAFTGELLSVLDGGVSGGPALLDLETVYRQLLGAFHNGRVTEPQLSSRGLGAKIALVRNRLYRPGTVAVSAPLVLSDPSELLAVLERVAKSRPDVSGPIQGDYAAVADGLERLRADDVIESGVMFRLMVALGRIAEAFGELNADQHRNLTVTAAARSMSAVMDRMATIEREEYLATVAELPQLVADLEPRTLTIGTWARPLLSRALFDDLTDQLATEFEEALMGRIRPRIARLISEFVNDLSMDVAWTGGGVLPPELNQALLDRMAETLRDVFRSAAFTGLTKWAVPTDGPIAPPLGLAMVFGPAQIVFIRGLVAEAMARRLRQRDTEVEYVNGLRRQSQEWLVDIQRRLERDREQELERMWSVVAADADRALRVVRALLDEEPSDRLDVGRVVEDGR